MNPLNMPSGGLGPDGLPRPLKQPSPEQEQQGAVLFSDAAEAGADAVEVANEVMDEGVLGGIGDLMSGAVDLAGSAISGGAEVVASVASGTVDILGTVASGAGEAIGTVASHIPDALSSVGGGVGAVVEGAGSAADGCGSCSLAIVLFFLAAGSAVAAVLR